MSRLLTLVLSGVFALSLAACGQSDENKTDAATDTSAQSMEATGDNAEQAKDMKEGESADSMKEGMDTGASSEEKSAE